jgi:peptidoglycan/LPS O-acetylase OafA/YrhL
VKSIGAVLDKSRGIGPGFDFLRLLLALWIFHGHAIWLAGGHTDLVFEPHATATAAAVLQDGGSWTGIKRPIHVALVPMFFALSGFLVIGSAFRLRDVRTFLAFRGLRLFPALLVEVTLSALFLGAAVTSLPLTQYFRSPIFWRYFGNCVGEVTFALPGVFQHNPVPSIVNVNLWTLPAELMCYVITAALLITGLLFRRNILTAMVLTVFITVVCLNLFTNIDVTPGILSTNTITLYFIVGVMFYIWREHIPAHSVICFAAGIAAYTLLMFRHSVDLAAPFVVYCTVYIGLLRIPKIPLASTGDYSYGIYLYGFPISQAVILFVPWVRGRGWVEIMIALVPTCLFAALSWHMVEKHALKLKRFLPAQFFPVRPRVIVSQTEVVSTASNKS